MKPVVWAKLMAVSGTAFVTLKIFDKLLMKYYIVIKYFEGQISTCYFSVNLVTFVIGQRHLPSLKDYEKGKFLYEFEMGLKTAEMSRDILIQVQLVNSQLSISSRNSLWE